MTRQKKIMSEELNRMKSFFDAYKLHKSVSKRDMKIGIATIYRFLNDLEHKGEIHSFICENRKVYSTNKTSHAIFRCEKCGDSKHMDVKDLGFIKGITDRHVCHFQIEINGLCIKCESKSR